MSEDNPKVIGSVFLDIMYILIKNRKFLIIFTSLSLIIALIIGLLIPKTYKATSSVVAAEQSDLLSSLGGISSLAKSFSPLKGLGSLSGSSELDKYVAILKSATMKHTIIDTFNLRKAYDMEADPYWKVEKELSDNLDFQVADEGNLDINVYDKDPARAAKMANFLVVRLNDVNTELHITNAKFIREFVEKRYFQNVKDIADLEEKMKEFQTRSGVIAVPEQIEATIKSISTLYADLAKEEIAYNVLKRTTGSNNSDNPILRNKEIEVQEIRNKISNINSSAEKNDNNNVLVPLKTAPKVLGEYLKIYKNLEIQYKIAEFIIPVYEQSKIEEARNTPSVLILDKAYPPERKAKPKIALILLIAFVVSMVIGLFIVFFIEMLRKLQMVDPIKYESISRIIKPMKRLIPNNHSV